MSPDKENPKYNSMEGIAKRGPVYEHRKHIPNNENNLVNTEKEYIDKNSLEEDQKTQNAIDDIVLSESNSLMQVEDKNIDKIRRGYKKQRSKFYKIVFNKWNFVIIGFLLIAIFAVPYTRYKVLGLFLKNNVSIEVIDSDSKDGVSGVVIRVDGLNYKTDVNGLLNLNLKLGNHSFSFNKPYYTFERKNIFVGFNKKPTIVLPLNSTGRALSVEVLNKFNLKPIQGAVINILGSDYITNINGMVRMILSTSSESYPASISAKNYDNTNATIVQSLNGTMNIITMVPSGNIFYLTNQNNKLYLMKSNLDGSSPSVVVEPSGKEDLTNSKIYQSLDGKYLILFANRGGNNNQLYSVSTTTGQLTEIDNGTDKINPIGYIGDDFFYDVISSSVTNNASGYESIKMVNLVNSQTTNIDQNNSDSSDSNTYAYQQFTNFTILYNQLIYLTKWIEVGGYDLSSLNDTIRGFNPNTNNTKDYYSFNLKSVVSIDTSRYAPNSVYIRTTNNSTPQTYSYFSYNNGSVAPANIDDSTFNSDSENYFFSEGGNQTFWNNDGSIYMGDNLGKNPVNLGYTGYLFYSWFNSDYILITKGTTLYLASINGVKVYPISNIIL